MSDIKTEEQTNPSTLADSIEQLSFQHLKYFILDVDGVMTDGKFTYTENGKISKNFGAHDHDGLKLIAPKLAILFITGDHRGFQISRRRIEKDMKYKLQYVSEAERDLFLSFFGYDKMIYMGDGHYDAPCLEKAVYGIAPANAVEVAKSSANFVTEAKGGEGAVYEACLHLLEKLK